MPRAASKRDAPREAFVYSLCRPLEINHRSVDMKVALAAMLSLLALLMTCNEKTITPPAEPATVDGWRQLFNGHDLDNWQHVGPGKLVIENGVLRTEDGMGLLW